MSAIAGTIEMGENRVELGTVILIANAQFGGASKYRIALKRDGGFGVGIALIAKLIEPHGPDVVIYAAAEAEAAKECRGSFGRDRKAVWSVSQSVERLSCECRGRAGNTVSEWAISRKSK